MPYISRDDVGKTTCKPKNTIDGITKTNDPNSTLSATPDAYSFDTPSTFYAKKYQKPQWKQIALSLLQIKKVFWKNKEAWASFVQAE